MVTGALRVKMASLVRRNKLAPRFRHRRTIGYGVNHTHVQLAGKQGGKGASMKNPVRLLLHVPVPWVFVLTYLVGALLQRLTPGLSPSAISPEVARKSVAVGGVLFVVGAIIAGWGLIIFRKARTTTVPGKSSARLVIWGPYRFTRNPMYVGLVLAYLGEAGLLKQIWPVMVLPLVIAYVNWIVIPVEEARLKEDYQEEYSEYRSRVRRWI
jgi:protein-S-isoprenylcysteine O-methyltransferase Ste14